MTIMKKLGGMLAVAVLGIASLAAQGGVTYFHNDITGSPVAATNEAGAVIWRESYRPYGERRVNSASASDNKVWFTSRRQDVDTGLVYMGARYYDPMIGRFISMDPVGFQDTNVHNFNRYAYGNNNPYRYVDPDGRTSIPVVGAVLVLGVGAAITMGNPSQEQRERIARLGRTLGNLIFNENSEGAGEKEASSGTESKAGQNAEPSGDKPDGPASEKTARDFAKRLERDLGKEARREFHDAKEKGAGDRTLDQLKNDARDIYSQAGKPTPDWLK